VIVAVVVVAVLGAAVAGWRKHRSRSLREGFGPEYERAVAESPTRREAEAELDERRKRHDELDLRPLSAEQARGYAGRWSGIQERFVDDLSVDHPELVQHYRAAMAVRDDGDTEGLREAFVSYRALFEELLQTEDARATNPR